MTNANSAGLPPRQVDGVRTPGPGDMLRARMVNLLGLFTPIANLGMKPYADAETRWVGVGAGFIFLGGALWGYLTGRAWALQGGVAGHYVLVLIGLIHPMLILGPAKLWIEFGKLLGLIMQWPIFGGIYYLVVTPLALIVRATSGDPLRRKAPPEGSYWTEHTPPAKEQYERQF